MKFEEKIKEILTEGKKPWKKGEEVDYHGRTGTITGYEGGYAIVSFDDTGEEEAIDIDELIEQGN